MKCLPGGADRRARTGRLTRRSFLLSTAAMALLSACGRRAQGGESAATDGRFPRTVAHRLGEATVRAEPVRVASVSDGAELSSVLALGVTPVGFGYRNDPLRPWISGAAAFADEIDRVPVTFGDIDWERFARWRPDLIVGQEGFLWDGSLRYAEGIAPTVATQNADWRGALRIVAEATGREGAARDAEAAIDARIAAAAASIEAYKGRSIVMLLPTITQSGQVGVSNDSGPIGQVFMDLGLRTRAATTSNPVDRIPLERVQEIDADLIGVRPTAPADMAAFPEFLATGLLSMVPAARSGHVVVQTIEQSDRHYFASALTVADGAEEIARIVSAAFSG